MRFSLAGALKMGWIQGLIRWILNIFTISPWKIYFFSSRTMRPKIVPHHFTCDKIGSKKFDKVERGLRLDS